MPVPKHFRKSNHFDLPRLGIALEGYPISIQTLINILNGARELLRAVDDLESDISGQREAKEIHPEIQKIHFGSLELIISPQQSYEYYEYASSVFTTAYRIIQGLYEECLEQNRQTNQGESDIKLFYQRIIRQAMEVDASRNGNTGVRIFNGIATLFRVGSEVKHIQIRTKSFNGSRILDMTYEQARRISKEAKAQASEAVLKILAQESPIFTFRDLKGGPEDLAANHDQYLVEQ